VKQLVKRKPGGVPGAKGKGQATVMQDNLGRSGGKSKVIVGRKAEERSSKMETKGAQKDVLGSPLNGERRGKKRARYRELKKQKNN